MLPCRYEEEINKRTNAENEFVTIKKVSRFCGVELIWETIKVMAEGSHIVENQVANLLNIWQ